MATPDPVRLIVIFCNWTLLLIVLCSGMLISGLQLAITICTFLPKEFRIGACQNLANTWWILFPFTIQVYAGVPVIWYGDAIGGGSSMIIGNHRSTLDFSIGALIAAHAPNLGCGRLVPLMKDVLRFMPGVGWICYFSGAVFLKRNWLADRNKLEAKVKEMITLYPRPFWLGLYPEGTRFTEKKLVEAQEFVRKRNAERPNAFQLAVPENTLIPRPKGFVFFSQHDGLRSCLETVNDFTIGCYGGDLRLSQFIRGEFKTKALHIHVNRIPISELPKEKEELEKWLYKSFERKDARLGYLKKHGTFPTEDTKIIPKYAPSRLNLLAGFSAWASLWALVLVSYAHWFVIFLYVVSSGLIVIRSLRVALTTNSLHLGEFPRAETKS